MIKEQTVRFKMTSWELYSGIMFTSTDGTIGYTSVSYYARKNSFLLNTDDYDASVPIPNMINMQEDELFQLQFVLPCKYDLELIKNIQLHLIQNFRDFTASTQYEIQIKY